MGVGLLVSGLSLGYLLGKKDKAADLAASYELLDAKLLAAELAEASAEEAVRAASEAQASAEEAVRSALEAKAIDRALQSGISKLGRSVEDLTTRHSNLEERFEPVRENCEMAMTESKNMANKFNAGFEDVSVSLEHLQDLALNNMDTLNSLDHEVSGFKTEAFRTGVELKSRLASLEET